ncbi:MAG TPA: glucose-6-phosphate dehydrogenase assembly protein OpcA [Solirubrobacteraceae bacterium]|nr:glucose-6-phosphate dehydrogenase assembly protein OpcA [Solirubrobacteraceae bacterium]
MSAHPTPTSTPIASTPEDAVWSAEGTTPDAIEGALRELLSARARDIREDSAGGVVPARVMNMIVFVSAARREEIVGRLGGVGRYHASRTVILSYEPARERLDARVSVAHEGEAEGAGNGRDGQLALLRETVTVELGERHLDDLATIADPLVISDLPTLLWSPGGHPAAADELLGLAQAALIDSTDETGGSSVGWHAAIERACTLTGRVYVVDLAWLRSIPWRERVAATFDPPRMRAELACLSGVRVSHHGDSTIAATLMVGWLASRLGWQLDRARLLERAGSGGELAATARAGGREIDLRLTPAPELTVPGLQGVELHSESGLRVRLDRGPGGLRAHRRERDGTERSWSLLGASRGERGILGEGIRQALLRDPTYTPALHAANAMLP